jgi:hypothetical protein
MITGCERARNWRGWSGRCPPVTDGNVLQQKSEALAHPTQATERLLKEK